MSELIIEDGIPIPSRTNLPELPLDQMKIGQSFEVSLQSEREISSVRQKISRYHRINKPKRFTVRVTDPDTFTVRVFRVSDY